ncbi:hypothetical protein COB55_02965 [Candidatus Wolfebacteria bacterium]|nr:MAG: hypothetical protein COB55_02965 [Candidatus Wolfebacteria bacterium]
MIEFNEEKQELRLKELRIKEEEDLAQILAKKYKIPYLDLTTVSTNIDALRLVSEEEARAGELASFTLIGKKVGIAVRSPESKEITALVGKLEKKGYVVSVYMASKKSLEWVWRRYKDLSFSSETKAGILDVANAEISTIMEKIKTRDDVDKIITDVLSQKRSYRVSRILEIILAGGIGLGVSDIHLEPAESEVRLRYRLHGVLADVAPIDNDTFRLLLSRIKLLSGLKLNKNSIAQDGRFSIKINDREIQIRTSILPGAYNESIVLRLLDPENIGVKLEELGINKKLFAVLTREIQKPNGMILNTGPTGSGKTTTLYAFLQTIHTPDIKIITIEDPIEYHLPGIVQTQVDKEKYTFSQGLRSALRQDPDVIMVGEIRDNETASIAVNAALTGHLVFSTLHTNSAAGAFPRLVDLGVDPKVISSAISIVIAQRLVRKLNKDVASQIPLEGNDRVIVENILKTLPDGEAPVQTDKVWKLNDGVTDASGYTGRLGIYEAIVVDTAIEEVIRTNPSARDILKASSAQGLLTMRQDGILKVLDGTTTLDELRRVVDIDELISDL